MTLLVKICGVTREADIESAVDAGADAIGFVFHDASPRNLAPSRAARLAEALPARVLRIAVTLHPTRQFVRSVLAEFTPDVWQSDDGDFDGIAIPDAIGRWPVIRSAPAAAKQLPPVLLFDAAVSGNGEQADWDAATRVARRSRLIIGGGLAPETVGRAARAIRPFGVDVSSGVESAPGVKDGALIRRFVAAARAAERGELP